MYTVDPNRPAGPTPVTGSNGPYNPPVVSSGPAYPIGTPPAFQPYGPGAYYTPVPYAPPVNAGQGKAVASLVLGIVSLVLGFYLVGLPCAIVGLVFGILAKRQHAGSMATAGIVLCAVGLALSLFLLCFILIVTILMFQEISSWGYTHPYDVPYDACISLIQQLL